MKNLAILLLVFSSTVHSLELKLPGNAPRELVQGVEEVKELLPVKMNDTLTSSIKIKFLKSERFYNKNRTGVYSGVNDTIYINPKILSDSLLLKKTLLHEIAHAYEDKVEKLWKKPDYQLIAGYHKRGLILKRLKQHNYKVSDSPDVYEYKSPRESFPVNFEYFITDPEFQCRRPQLYNYLKEHLNHIPNLEVKCEYPDVLPIWIQNKVHWEKVDFSKLYQVHYLFASEGDPIMSRWGHSMIRLVFCSPQRKEKSEACLRDISSHLVISYRASVQDISINYLKGIQGKYASQGYIFPLVEIIREYNKVDLRDLISLPINLNESQLKSTEIIVKEMALTYAGKYRFFTTNCATETLNFFQSLVKDEDLHALRSLSPLGLLKHFNKLGVIDRDLVKNEQEAIKKTYFFKSQGNVVEKAFKNINEYSSKRSLKKYFKKSSPTNRRMDWNRSSLTGKEVASFLLLEKQILEVKQKELMESIAKRVQKRFVSKKEKEVVAMMEELRMVFIDNNEIPDFKSYGIPLAHEFTVPAPKEVQYHDVEKTEAWMKKYFGQEIKEVKAINENILELTNRLKSLI